LENLNPTAPATPGVAALLAALEAELEHLDQIGAHIAAAQLDAAIHQRRMDQARGDIIPPSVDSAV